MIGLPATMPAVATRVAPRENAVTSDAAIAVDRLKRVPDRTSHPPAAAFASARRVPLAIVGGFTAGRDLESQALLEDDIVIVASPGIARARPTLRDLEKLTWISREEGSSTRATFEAAFRDIGLSPEHRFALPSWEAVKLAVAKGAGVAVISRYAVIAELAAGSLAIVHLPGWKVRRHFSLIRARDVPLTPPAERFRELLLSEVGKLSRMPRSRARARRPAIAARPRRQAGARSPQREAT